MWSTVSARSSTLRKTVHGYMACRFLSSRSIRAAAREMEPGPIISINACLRVGIPRHGDLAQMLARGHDVEKYERVRGRQGPLH
jgi:hypothetical protein